MRRLQFTDDEKSKDIYQTLYMGFLMGAPPEGLRGVSKNRLAMKIMDKFDALAKKDVDYKPGDSRVMLPSGDLLPELRESGEVVLEDVEVAMLMEHVENCPWRPIAARSMVAAVEFVESAPEE